MSGNDAFRLKLWFVNPADLFNKNEEVKKSDGSEENVEKEVSKLDWCYLCLKFIAY